MKKINVVALLLLIISFTVKSQNAYYDAVKLKSFIDNSTGKLDTSKAAVKEYSAILKKYSTNESQDAASIVQLYKFNPFIKDLIPAYGSSAGGNILRMNEIASSAAKSMGGMNVTNFADGMAKFLVERTKQELNTAFFEKFYTAMQENKDLQILFPRTFSVLNVLGKEIYNASIYMNILREAFENDLSNIIGNTRNFIDHSKNLESLRKDSTIYSSIMIGLDLSESLQQGMHPAEAISALSTKKYIKIDPRLLDAIKVYSFLSNSLRSYLSDRYWISMEEFRKLEDPIVLKFYLGLLYQSMPENLSLGNKKYKREILGKYVNNPKDYFDIIVSLYTSFHQVEESINTLKIKGKDASGYDYYRLYNNILALVDVSYKGLSGDTIAVTKEYKKIKAYAHLTGDVYLNVAQKKYSMAIMNLVIFVDSIQPKNTLSPFVLKYGGFMAAVVQAENSDQVKQAIEAIALPSGSSRIKRESLWNISINAYLGGYGGAEYIQKLKTGNLKASAGLSAPIGIAFSRGSKFLRKDKTKPGWSYTAFVSFIDIGAIASFRLKDSTTAALPQLKLENILAPGIYLIAGIPKCPISLGMFCQYGPSLRTVYSQNISLSSIDQTTWRIGGMIAVDIPLLNLYNKGR